MRRYLFSIIFFFFLLVPGKAQVETVWYDSVSIMEQNLGFFFTNRPLKKSNEDGTTFRNRWTRQTKNLYFSMYDFDNDSIILKYQATKTCHKHEYPSETITDNYFYKIYKDLRSEKGIKNVVIVIPGYAKTFKNQLSSYMYRLKGTYGDTLNTSMAFITFAWGDQSVSQFYYKGKRSANRAANDFAIFQNMLESFLADSAFFAEHPKDLSFSLICLSMGNQLLKRYMIKREEQGIDLVPAYKKILFIGSDASIDSFEEGKGFHNLTQMSDSVIVLVNRRDLPLTMSQYMNMQLRMGRGGISNLDELPGSIRVVDITGIISWADLPAMGHDYFLRNKVLKDILIDESIRKNE